MNRIKMIIVTCLVAIGVTSCSTVAISGRNRLNLVPDNAILQASFAQYSDFISKAPKSKNATQTKRIQEIGMRIAKATDAYLRAAGMAADADVYRWEFNLIASPEVNAFCMPGGKIVVYEGILPVAKNDDQLATVISHEVAHAVAKHANERMSQQVLQQYGANALSMVLGGKGAATQQISGMLYSLGSQVFVTLPYSRKHEYEADIIGLYLMAIAGYDYTQAEDFWTNMSGGGGNRSDFLSTHPNDANRIAAIRAEIPKVKAFMTGEKEVVTPKNTAALAPNAKAKTNLNEINKGREVPIQVKY